MTLNYLQGYIMTRIQLLEKVKIEEKNIGITVENL